MKASLLKEKWLSFWLNIVWPPAGPPRNNKTEMWEDGTLHACKRKTRSLWNSSWLTVAHWRGLHRGAVWLSTCTGPLRKSHSALTSASFQKSVFKNIAVELSLSFRLQKSSSVQLNEAPLKHYPSIPVEYLNRRCVFEQNKHKQRLKMCNCVAYVNKCV